MCLGGVEIEENGSARQADDEHESDERGLPDEEPDGGLLAIVVVFQGHDAGHHLGLACHAQTPEEERADPQGHPKRQVGGEEVDHAGVDLFE